MSDVQLQRFFKFDEDDLAANCAGKLSMKQEKRIQNEERLRSSVYKGIGIAFIMVALGVAWNTIQQESFFPLVSRNDVLKIVAEIGLPTLLLAFVAWYSFRIADNKVDYSVRHVTGRICFVKTEKVFSEKKPNGWITYRGVEDYKLGVGRMVFENLNGEIFRILHEGDLCVFYYTKDTKDILSVEYLAKGK